jgi:methylenetetrahydrofolate dehydrogenase (NADP+)/methenyltetrahydrofolate cyclohydrolase
MEFINKANLDLYGKNVLIVGFSNLLGKPLSVILANKFATVSVAHIATYETGQLPLLVSKADILITAVGKANLIKADWIKDGAVIIDAGISKTDDNVLVGDVEFDKALKKASLITPVPGGVGVLTVAFLFKNLLLVAKKQNQENI